MENQTQSPSLATFAPHFHPEAPLVSSGADGAAPRTIRITSKQFTHPVTKQVLREGFPAFDLEGVNLPFDFGGTGKEMQIANELVALAVKELVQLKERQQWVDGAKPPFNPTNGEQVKQWFRAAFSEITTEQLFNKLFAPTTRLAAFGAGRWEKWLKGDFIKALNLYYSSKGEPVLSAPKQAATLALMKQGRGMQPHNKVSFIKRFESMLESESLEVLELMTTSEAQSALDWLTAEQEEANAAELDI